MINERKIAFKYLCKKKSRSLATLFAIALATFIVFVSGNLILSALYADKAEDLKKYGNHIAYLDGIKTQDIQKLEEDGAVVCAVRNHNFCFGEIKGDKHMEHVFFYSFEDFSKFPYSYKITEGSVPKQPGEIMLHEDFKYVLGDKYEIGDSFTTIVDQMNGEIFDSPENGEVTELVRTYTLAGYYDCPDTSWLRDPVILVKDEPRTTENLYRVYITSEEEGIEDLESLKGLKEKEDWARNLGDTYGATVVVNDVFRKAQSTVVSMAYCVILMIGVFIGGFAAVVIRNSFAISVVERTRDYGMLRCIGASKRQIRKIAFCEAVMLGIGGEFVGILVSYVFLGIGIGIGKHYISFLEGFHLTWRPLLMSSTCLIIFLVVLFGLLEPTRQINKLKPLDALRNQKDVKKEWFRAGKRIDRFIGKIFGMEGEYAYKNLIRNRKKFITTTVSCVVSIAFFVGINAAFIYFGQLFEEVEIYPYYNAEIIFDEKLPYSLDSMEQELESIEGVSNVVFCYQYYFENENLKKKGSTSKIRTFTVVSLDEERYPIEKDSIEEGVVGNLEPGECYIINWRTRELEGERVEFSEVSLGDRIELSDRMAGGEEEEKYISELKVKAILEEQPIQDIYDEYPVLLVSEEEFRNLCLEQGIFYEEKIEIHLKMDADCDVDKVQELAQNHGMVLDDLLSEMRKIMEQIKMARVIVNVILILVALITSMNLFNSMESNFILREGERKILRAVGMSRKQYRKMILLEGMLSVIIALILGTAVGVGFGYGIYSIMSLTVKELKFVVPVGSILIAAVGLILLTLISSISGMKE